MVLKRTRERLDVHLLTVVLGVVFPIVVGRRLGRWRDLFLVLVVVVAPRLRLVSLARRPGIINIHGKKSTLLRGNRRTPEKGMYEREIFIYKTRAKTKCCVCSRRVEINKRAP